MPKDFLLTGEKDAFGRTPLQAACRIGDLKKVKETWNALSSQEQEYEGISNVHRRGYSAMMYSVHGGFLPIVRYLVEDGHMSLQNDDGLLVSIACTQNKPDILAYLLQHGANPNPPFYVLNNRENESLCVAVRNGYTKIVVLLLRELSLKTHCKHGKVFCEKFSQGRWDYHNDCKAPLEPAIITALSQGNIHMLKVFFREIPELAQQMTLQNLKVQEMLLKVKKGKMQLSYHPSMKEKDPKKIFVDVSAFITEATAAIQSSHPQQDEEQKVYECGDECCICLAGPAEVVIPGCGHQCLCTSQGCLQMAGTRCPICRQHFNNSRIKLPPIQGAAVRSPQLPAPRSYQQDESFAPILRARVSVQ